MRNKSKMSQAKLERKNVIDKVYTIDEIKELTLDIFKKYEVEKAYLFGSYARGEADELSDIYFMIKRGKVESLFEVDGMCYDLEEALGKEIDITTEESYTDDLELLKNKKDKHSRMLRYLKESFYNNIKKDMIEIYQS